MSANELAVLLVDDEKTVLDALKGQIRNLYAAQVTCETAESVSEAQEVLAELAEDEDVRIVLVVSDWLMPEIKGDELLHDVKKRYPAVYRVMLTGQADSAAIARVRDAELAHKLLFKPWSEDDLRGALDAAFAL